MEKFKEGDEVVVVDAYYTSLEKGTIGKILLCHGLQGKEGFYYRILPNKNKDADFSGCYDREIKKLSDVRLISAEFILPVQEVAEMTVAEIEVALGKKIKIIK